MRALQRCIHSAFPSPGLEHSQERGTGIFTPRCLSFCITIKSQDSKISVLASSFVLAIFTCVSSCAACQDSEDFLCLPSPLLLLLLLHLSPKGQHASSRTWLCPGRLSVKLSSLRPRLSGQLIQWPAQEVSLKSSQMYRSQASNHLRGVLCMSKTVERASCLLHHWQSSCTWNMALSISLCLHHAKQVNGDHQSWEPLRQRQPLSC